MIKKIPLVLLPGYSSNALLWQHQIKHLSNLIEPYVFVFEAETTIGQMAQRVLQEVPGNFVVAGHSMGGWIAQRLAIMAPERVKKMCLLSTWTGNNRPEFIDMFEEIAQAAQSDRIYQVFDDIRASSVSPTLQEDQAILTTLKTMQDAFPTTGYVNQARAIIDSQSVEQELNRIQCPTLIVQGEDDMAFTMEEQYAMHHGIPHSHFTLIPECGHMLPLERPHTITTLLRLMLMN